MWKWKTAPGHSSFSLCFFYALLGCMCYWEQGCDGTFQSQVGARIKDARSLRAALDKLQLKLWGDVLKCKWCCTHSVYPYRIDGNLHWLFFFFLQPSTKFSKHILHYLSKVPNPYIYIFLQLCFECGWKKDMRWKGQLCNDSKFLHPQ